MVLQIKITLCVCFPLMAFPLSKGLTIIVQFCYWGFIFKIIIIYYPLNSLTIDDDAVSYEIITSWLFR